MKKSVKIIAMALLLVSVLVMLVSCSKYSALKKAFEKEGYAENEDFNAVANSIKADLEKEDFAVEIHLLTKSDSTLKPSALVVEFKSTEDMVKAYEDSEAIKGLVKDIESNEDVQKVYSSLENAGFAKGNCFVIPLSLLYMNEITNIVKSVK